jgi:hypothetical protein
MCEPRLPERLAAMDRALIDVRATAPARLLAVLEAIGDAVHAVAAAISLGRER